METQGIINKRYILSDFSGRSNNLQFVRFLAAVLVVFHHTFPLATGKFDDEWLYNLTNGQIHFGGLAVSIFFLCGGYFAAQTTLKDNRSLIQKLKDRYIRLAKPLVFVVLMCILIGKVFSIYSITEYYCSLDTWRYLLNIFLIPVHNLPGVFGKNILYSTVNGALWTLPLEYICFSGCVLLGELNLLRKKRILFTVPLVVLGEIFVWHLSATIPLIGEIIRPTILFYIGMMYYLYKDRIVLSTKCFIVSLFLIILLTVFSKLFWGMVILFPYCCFFVWFNKRQLNSGYAKLGDYSYSIYLWGYPVQQAIISCFGGKMNPYQNFVLSLPLIILLGVLTSRTIEKNPKLKF